MNKLDNFRFSLGKKELIPIMQGAMGMDISTSKMALEVARLGGIGHISDAIVTGVTDRYFGTDYMKKRFQKYKSFVNQSDKSAEKFDLREVKEAITTFVNKTMEAKKGPGSVFINIMEKLTMNNAKETLFTRLNTALDAGIDGISLAAGLHMGSMGLMADNPRFRDAKIGIIVSSVRALKIFLSKSAKLRRLPDYVVVEGPLAGGHLGFKINDWHKFDLKTIVQEILGFLKKEDLNIPVIPAGGIFTGTDATDYMEMGASAVQLATRFTVTKESGLPDKVQQEYFRATEDQIVVNQVSPTGYPMRMLTNSPCIGTGMRPNCESMGFLLDDKGKCSYIAAYNRELAKNEEKIRVEDKTCLCSYMKSYGTWTCGHMTYRLKDTTNLLPDNTYQQLTVEEVIHDYMQSTDHQIILPAKYAS